MNDIVSRIKFFLAQMGIANSLFADVCGIPRPSLSQLLNGRNKKVSNEVIDKIHAAYPEINMMWLMFGDGEMLVPNANRAPQSADDQAADNVFSATANNAGREMHQQQAIKFDDDDAASYVPRKPQQPMTQRQHVAVNDAIAAATRTALAPAKRAAVAGERRITSVVIVFNDGTTQTIVP